MRRLLATVLLSLLVAAPGTALAGTLDGTSIIGVLQPLASKNTCGNFIPQDCNGFQEAYIVTGDLLTSYDLYILAVEVNPLVGLGGALFGIHYDDAPNAGLDIFGWTLCGDLEFPSIAPNPVWPAASSVNIVTFITPANCQTSIAPGDDKATANLGSLYAYAYGDDIFTITPRTFTPGMEFEVADCNAATTHLPWPNNAGHVGFGIHQGHSICCEHCGTPVEPTSWSRIKSTYDGQ